jgi:DNA-binding CsgD family transcriptional regulator
MRPAGQARLAAAGVTAREAEVLAVVGGRLTNQEIAERLCISVRTVESHVSALLRKLMLPGRPALIQMARELAAEPALPVPPTSFVGREEELAQLGDLLAAGPLVCLTGPAGCGKTRLALEAARRWVGETRIAGLASAAAADVTAIIAVALGLGYESADLATAARVALAGRSLLLVADDCDQVTWAAAEQLTALVRAVPGLRVVATSTRPATATATSWPTSTTSGRSTSGCRAGWTLHATFSTARLRCSARPAISAAPPGRCWSWPSITGPVTPRPRSACCSKGWGWRCSSAAHP